MNGPAMRAPAVHAHAAAPASPASLLVAGVVLAALTEAVAGTALSLGRADLMGDLQATPDEFAWLDVAYTTAKLLGFLLAPWAMQRFGARRLAVVSTLAMGLACALAAGGAPLGVFLLLRGLQGAAGGALLVVGQAMLFLAFPASRQPFLQALFAMGAVVAPATLAPAFQGWAVDSLSWAWIFAGVVPVALAAAGLLLMADEPPAVAGPRGFDGIGFALAAVGLGCLVYVFSTGARWDWFEAPHVRAAAVLGISALLAWLGQQLRQRRRGLLDFALFRSDDFSFAFLVSFVAGAALFGSAFLIPAFALSVLGFTPTAAGALLLPSGALFAAALLIAAGLMQLRRLPPVATVPWGILMIMASMAMLSGSSRASGTDEMMAAVLLRGFGLGFLFLSITLIAFTRLPARRLAGGIGLFNAGRLVGGLAGVAGLQTLIDRGIAGNAAVLGANLVPGDPALAARLGDTTALLASRGLDALSASRGAVGLLGRAVHGEAAVIAFDTAFAAVALLFVCAAPVLVATKIGLARLRARRRPSPGS